MGAELKLKLFQAGFGVLILLTSPALAQTPTPPPASSDAPPRWVRRPNGEDVELAYPVAARRAGLDGYIRLRCRINLRGSLEDCAILDESPPGMGFGEAALQLSRHFAVAPRRRDGHPVDDEWVNLPINLHP